MINKSKQFEKVRPSMEKSNLDNIQKSPKRKIDLEYNLHSKQFDKSISSSDYRKKIDLLLAAATEMIVTQKGQ